MIVKKGSNQRALVKEIQEVVGAKPDGIFGDRTEALVMKYQRENYLVADGIVGPNTFECMGILDTDTSKQYSKEEDITYHKHHLPNGEYIDTPTKKDYVFIHHTAGWNNPYKVIDSWGRDTRGRIATEFVIGGQKIDSGDSTYDGDIVQAFPEGYYAYHLGSTGSSYMHSHSVGIELCNFGYLKDGKTYVGTRAKEDQIAILDEAFKGYLTWHKYSDKQIKSTQLLIEHIAARDQIDVREGLPELIRKHGPVKAFGFNEDAYKGKIKGLLTHTNVRKDKSDCFPQPELVDMLLSL